MWPGDKLPGIGHDSGGFYFVQKSAETITDRRGFGKGSCCEKGDVAMPLFQKVAGELPSAIVIVADNIV